MVQTDDPGWTYFFFWDRTSSCRTRTDRLRNNSRVSPCGLWPKVAALLEAPVPKKDVPPDAVSCSAQKKLYLDIKLRKYQNIFDGFSGFC